MLKKELIAKVAELTGEKKTVVEKVVNAALTTVQDELVAGAVVSLNNFGAFSVTERAARTGRNPQTGKEIEIPASKVVKFKPSSVLKTAVNK